VSVVVVVVVVVGTSVVGASVVVGSSIEKYKTTVPEPPAPPDILVTGA
jgi:hypothetical protein